MIIPNQDSNSKYEALVLNGASRKFITLERKNEAAYSFAFDND
jgi:hypothetical protein